MKRVQTILIDDHDGEVLPEGTGTLDLKVNRKEYSLHLSEANADQLLTLLSEFLGDESLKEQGKKSSSKNGSKKADDEVTAIRKWAQENKIQHNGKSLGERGRIPQAIKDQYYEAVAKS